MQPGGREVTEVEKKHMLVVTLLGLELQPGSPLLIFCKEGPVAEGRLGGGGER